MTSVVVPVRPSYRPYLARVVEVRPLSDNFVRISFSGPEFEHFGQSGLDQRIKVVIPFQDGSMGDFGQFDEQTIEDGTWYTNWRELPAAERNPFRTYTVRRIDPANGVLEVDFVLHHDPGPAGAWAAAAKPGDELVIVGPDERSEQSHVGLDWHPGSARRLLLAGDETAAPAICSILESLTGAVDVDAFIEVPTPGDVLPLTVVDGIRVHWIARGDASHGERLRDAVTAWTTRSAELLRAAAAPRPQELADIDVDQEILWDSPEEGEGEFYAWIAGESSVVKGLRRLLVTDQGVDRKRVAFMGYWRLGLSERQE